LKKLIGNTDIEDSLEKLDRLTQEEARMASAEQLRIAHSIEGKVIGVDERVQGVGDDMKNMGKTVEDVNDKVQDVDDKVQGVDEGVKDVGDRVQGVGRKLDDTNRSSSHIAHPLLPNTQAYSQGTCSATTFCDGFRLRIHP
jgi:methyl-accepting chemotaxis protein